MSKALALIYRPKDWSEVVEQESIKRILSNQLDTGTVKHGYLFCGPAGCGKTTSARIFASMINKGSGIPVELDAASHNSVDDIRKICDQAKMKPLDADYKVFILDEVHVLSSQAWQAMLKTLEEPPATAIFILCTTNPEKIPATILSRVQRYNFHKISFNGIVKRLKEVYNSEYAGKPAEYHNEEKLNQAFSLIAKLSDGCMREALTLMDKCLSYSETLTEENVIEALNITDYKTMFALSTAIDTDDKKTIISTINEVYNNGIDLKQFMKDFFEFVLDVNVYVITKDFSMIQIPESYKNILGSYTENNITVYYLMDICKLSNSLRWESNPKAVIIARLLTLDSKERLKQPVDMNYTESDKL